MNRRGFFGALTKFSAGAALTGAVPAVEGGDPPPAAQIAQTLCPMCGWAQPVPERTEGTPLPDHLKGMRRLQIATCCNDKCRARFAVRWVG